MDSLPCEVIEGSWFEFSYLSKATQCHLRSTKLSEKNHAFVAGSFNTTTGDFCPLGIAFRGAVLSNIKKTLDVYVWTTKFHTRCLPSSFCLLNGTPGLQFPFPG